LLKIENLNIVAGKFRVKNLSLNLQSGLCHVIVGTTGSGKTLLLETIAGLRRPERGSIIFAGRDISLVEPEQRNISYLPQDLCLFPNMLVRENICYGLRINGFGREEADRRLQPLAVELDIAHLLDRHIDHLSGGERHRTALARAIISDSQLILLDEPFSSLNLGLKRKLWHYLKQLQVDRKWTMLLVTHDLEEAQLLGDDLSLIANGELVDTGPKSEVFCFPKTVSAACILGVENFLPARFEVRSNGFCEFYSPALETKLAVSASYPTLGRDDMAETCYKLGIRASDISICSSDFAGAIRGCVIENIFKKGRTATLVLRCPQKNFSLLVEADLSEIVGRAPGDDVCISIAPGSVMALIQN